MCGLPIYFCRGLVIHPADFTDAHERHWEDAECLFDAHRLANADQLYGFSAECGLKAVMQSLGMQTDQQGKPTDRAHQEHVDKLWKVFEGFMQGNGGRWFLGVLPPGKPFSNWSLHNRYAHGQHFSTGYVTPHRDAARDICGMIRQAKQDGRI